MGNTYDFRPNRSIKNVDPQAVGEELERIRREEGKLVPSSVVERAEPPDSPLHPAFEWDDAKAAHEHRLHQARSLIVSIRVRPEPEAKPMIAYVSVKTPTMGRSYVPTPEALSNDYLRPRILNELRTFIESLERRYAGFAEAAKVLAELKAMMR